uniref:Uncharacterized protein n=1 Tax=Peromyscus maniculatus bairdii TaxID=230844 RepID=A0A8C8W7C5_PERMB
MRRSAAPSQVQGNSFKKPKFIPPGRSNTSLNKDIIKMGPKKKKKEDIWSHLSCFQTYTYFIFLCLFPQNQPYTQYLSFNFFHYLKK